MKQRTRIYYTDSQKTLMWERWRRGDSLQKIAQLFDRNHSSVMRILAETGGIRPAQRCRSRLALTLAEREEISRAVVAGKSIHSIAASLGRAPSTASRRLDEMAAWGATGQARPMNVHGIGRDVPSRVSLCESQAGRHRCWQTAVSMVAGANRRLAKAGIRE